MRAGDDAQGEEAGGVQDGFAGGGGGVGGRGEEVARAGVFEEDVRCYCWGGGGVRGRGREGRFEDAEAGGED